MPRLQTPSRPAPEPQQTLCSPTALLGISVQSPYPLDRIPVALCLRVRGLLRRAAGLQARAADSHGFCELCGFGCLVSGSALLLGEGFPSLQEGCLQQRRSPLLRRPSLGAVTGRLQSSPGQGNQTHMWGRGVWGAVSLGESRELVSLASEAKLPGQFLSCGGDNSCQGQSPV